MTTPFAIVDRRRRAPVVVGFLLLAALVLGACNGQDDSQRPASWAVELDFDTGGINQLCRRQIVIPDYGESTQVWVRPDPYPNEWHGRAFEGFFEVDAVEQRGTLTGEAGVSLEGFVLADLPPRGACCCGAPPRLES